MRGEGRGAKTRRPEFQHAAKETFLAEFRKHGTIFHAAVAAEVGRSTVYGWLNDDPEFAESFGLALEDAIDVAEREAYRRGVEGWIEPVFGSATEVIEVAGKPKAITVTKEIGGIRKFSDKQLENYLRARRPEKYNVRQHEITGKDGAPLSVIAEPEKLSDGQLRQIANLLTAFGFVFPTLQELDEELAQRAATADETS